jgi:hypothetical protein
MYEDIKGALENGKMAYEYIASKEQGEAYAAMDGHPCFTIEWFQENFPLENSKGTAFEDYIKKTAADSCSLPTPEPVTKDPPAKENILVLNAAGTDICTRILDNAPEGRVGTKRIVSKPAKILEKADAESLLNTQGGWDLVIVGLTLDQPNSDSIQDIIDHQWDVIKFLLDFCKKAYLTDGCIRKMVILTNDIFNENAETYKARGLGMTTHATMYGYANTLRQEVEFPVMLIDIQDVEDPDMLPYVVDEIFRDSTFGTATVRLTYPYPIKDGVRVKEGLPVGRYVIRHTLTHPYERAGRVLPIEPEGCIIISGGNGALGLVMGRWLMTQAKQRKEAGALNPKFSIEFASRSAKLSDLNMPLWQDCLALASELGLKIEQVTMDMSSKAGVDKFIKERTPNVIGFIHSAGVLQDSMLPNQTYDKFLTCFGGKHYAALYIHDAFERFENPRLKFYWMFSSTSVYGNMGQLNYSSSNSYMDALARYRISVGKPACAMQWGAWGEVGMAATMDDAQRRRVMAGPFPYFPVVKGLEGMERGLSTGLPGFSTLLVNSPMMFGMVAPDQGPTQRNARGFYSGFVPLPAPESFDKDHTYDIYRMYRYIFNPYKSTDGPYYNTWVKLYIKDEPKDEDAMVEVGGYGGF